jgi:hypothetical protein
MSGVMDFVRPKPIPQGPIEKKLALEDNRRIVRSIGAGQVAGAWFLAWALTITIATPPMPVDFPEADTPPIITLKLPEDGYHSKTGKKPKQSAREHTNKDAWRRRRSPPRRRASSGRTSSSRARTSCWARPSR